MRAATDAYKLLFANHRQQDLRSGLSQIVVCQKVNSLWQFQNARKTSKSLSNIALIGFVF